MATPSEAFEEAERAGVMKRVVTPQVTPQDAIRALVGQTVCMTLFETSEVEGKYKKRTVEGVVNSSDTDMLYLGIDVTSSTVALEDE